MPVSYKWVPSVRVDRCTGCGLCESICPQGCLGVLDGIGALVRPGTCTSEASCVSACPQMALYLTWMRLDSDRSIGRWRHLPDAVAAARAHR